MTLTQRFLGLATLTLFLAGTSRVQADTAFTFTYSDGTNSAHGTLTAKYNVNGSFTATSGTLVVTGGDDVGTYSLRPNPSAPSASSTFIGLPFYGVQFIFDDLLWPGQNPSLTGNGLLFETPVPYGAMNEFQINIFANGSGAYSFWSSAGFLYKVTSDTGTFTLTLDSAGTIRSLKSSVQGLVSSGALLPADGNSLVVKLDAALGYQNEGDNADAIAVLTAFINQVNAFVKAGKLTPAQGASLTDPASAVIAALGG